MRDAQVERDEEREEQDMCRPLVHEATVIRLQWGGKEVLCAAQARRYDQHQESAQSAMFLPSLHEVPVVRLSGGYKPSLLSTPGGGHDRRSDQVRKKRPAKSGEQSAKPVLSPADASDESYDNTVEAVGDGGKRLKRNVWPRPPPPPMPPSPTTPRT